MNYFVYILRCNDGKSYMDCADNLEDRLERHQKEYVPATADRLPIEFFYFAIKDKYKAFEFEKYLNSGSCRAFINRHLV